MKTIYRILLVFIMLVQIRPLFFLQKENSFAPHLKSELHLLSYQAIDEFQEIAYTLFFIGIFSVVFFFISLVGLFFFWRSSRELFIASIAYLLLNTFHVHGNFFVYPNIICDLLFYLIVLLVVILSYRDPIKQCFVVKNVC
jgi:hypothetical protein